MPQYGKNLEAQHRTVHGYSIEENPYCSKCGLRTYPRWGPHDCTSRPDVKKIRHVAGDIIANLHFYRIPAEQQLAALAEALAFSFARNVRPTRLKAKLDATLPVLRRLTMRQASGPTETIVADLVGPRMTVKKKTPRRMAKKVKRR